MNFQELNEQIIDNDIRCQAIYPLFAIPCGGLIGSDIGEIIMEYDEDLNSVLGITDEIFDEFEHVDFVEAFIYENEKFGFLAKFAKPIPSKFYENGYSSSWGWYQNKWLYAETLEDLFRQANEWAIQMFEKYKAESDLKGVKDDTA